MAEKLLLLQLWLLLGPCRHGGVLDVDDDASLAAVAAAALA